MDETALSETFLPMKRRSPILEEESKSENSSTSTNQDPSAPRKAKCRHQKMNQNLIDKIVAGSKKKKKENKRNHDKTSNHKPALLPPVIVYQSKGSMSILKAPSMQIINRLYLQSKPIDKTPRVCKCGKTARYRLPKTLEPYCSLACYNALIPSN
ncbi:unnamed protein product [Blepharisma stoltei]|uniref:Uncharacterized protein n=1 Tax=Blepharisma stoltei TaxID=1481888 RepID=A0AAU9K6L6_9CILI|nr:unnamed protein product [Blepharisma stoltei]